jgi:hypothetical protein
MRCGFCLRFCGTMTVIDLNNDRNIKLKNAVFLHANLYFLLSKKYFGDPQLRKRQKFDYWLLHVCFSICPPSVRLSACNNSRTTTERILIKFHIESFY